MDEERDFAGISVPFAAGVSMAAALGSAGAGAAVGWGALAVIAATLLCCRRGPGMRAGIVLMLFCAGAFCAAADSLTILRPAPGPLMRLGTECCCALKEIIAGIGFGHDTTAPLLTALLTGDRSGLSTETIRQFRDSGASHILALSGLHLGIIYLILRRVFSIFGNSIAARRARYLLLIALSGFYTIMTGCGPSITRAFLFILITETAAILHRKRSAVRVLLLSAIIQLTLTPSSIRTVGFQLSYLAMCGIVFLQPHLSRIYDGEGLIKRIWDILTLSISCQAFTAPLSWFYFRSFPQYFLLTNLLAMPLTSLVMILAVVTVTLSAMGLCPGILIRTTDESIQIMCWVLKTVSGM